MRNLLCVEQRFDLHETGELFLPLRRPIVRKYDPVVLAQVLYGEKSAWRSRHVHLYVQTVGIVVEAPILRWRIGLAETERLILIRNLGGAARKYARGLLVNEFTGQLSEQTVALPTTRYSLLGSEDDLSYALILVQMHVLIPR